MNSTIIINGTVISGRNISVINGRVCVDGIDITPDHREVTITVTGDIESISADSCREIKVTGNVGKVQTVSGDVECGDVSGSVQTVSGDVECKNVGGSVKTVSGDITRG